jgi:hypothetical protein
VGDGPGMNLKLKLTQWVMDEPSKRATLYIKDNDDNPDMAAILMMTNPIEEIFCTDNNVAERHFVNVNVVEQLPTVKDGDFRTYPLVIHYEGYS